MFRIMIHNGNNHSKNQGFFSYIVFLLCGLFLMVHLLPVLADAHEVNRNNDYSAYIHPELLEILEKAEKNEVDCHNGYGNSTIQSAPTVSADSLFLPERIDDETGDDGLVEAIVLLRERPDLEKLRKNIELFLNPVMDENLKIVFIRHALVDFLREVADRSQVTITNLIEKHLNMRDGSVADFKTFFVVNAVYIKAVPEIIRLIALLPTVDSIQPNYKYQLENNLHQESFVPNDAGTLGVEPASGLDGNHRNELTIHQSSSGSNVTSTDTNTETNANTNIGTNTNTIIGTDTDTNNDTVSVANAVPEWGIRKIEADKVWNELNITGEGVVIGFLDTGANWQHPALKERWRGYNSEKPDSPDPVFNWYDPVTGRNMPRDIDTSTRGSHGTHIVGTALGSDGNNLIGVAPGARWIAANIFDNKLSASNNNILDAGQFMVAPVDADGVPQPKMAPHIINCSWGAPLSSPRNLEADEVLREMVKNWESVGIIAVVAASNYGPSSDTIGMPAIFPESFAVGATDSGNKIYNKSSRGPVNYYPGIIKPDLVAPGVSIRSSTGASGYRNKDGTSMATPHVAGTAALLLELRPGLTVQKIKDILTETATPLPNEESIPGNTFGHGLVNAYRAATKVLADYYDGLFIEDDALEKALREALNKPAGIITPEDMATLTRLNASEQRITRLSGIEFAVNLTDLDLSFNDIIDITPLKNLFNLEFLNLSHNLITGISPLAENSRKGGLGSDATVNLSFNRLYCAPDNDISANIMELEENGVSVLYEYQLLDQVERPLWTGPGTISWQGVPGPGHYEVILYDSHEPVATINVNAENTEPDEDKETAKETDEVIGNNRVGSLQEEMEIDRRTIKYDLSAYMKERAKESSATRSFMVTVQAKGESNLYLDGEKSPMSTIYTPFMLPQVAKPYWRSLILHWDAEEGTSGYRIRLYLNEKHLVEINSYTDNSFYNFSDRIHANEGEGYFQATVQALGDNIIYSSGAVSYSSEPYLPVKGIEPQEIISFSFIVSSEKESNLYRELEDNQYTGITPLILPDEATNRDIIWSSENLSVATVTEEGNIAPKGTGNTNIIAETIDGGFQTFYNVSVVKFGDVDGDNEVSVRDAILVLRQIVGLEDLNHLQKQAAGVSTSTEQAAGVKTSTETISVTDAIMILRYVVGLKNYFPVEKDFFGPLSLQPDE